MPEPATQAPVEDVDVYLLPRWTQQDWMADGACDGKTSLFFPPTAERPQARARREAKAAVICESCPVLIECRTYARVHAEYGYWGAENEEERTNAGYPVSSPIGTRRRSYPKESAPTESVAHGPVTADDSVNASLAKAS